MANLKGNRVTITEVARACGVAVSTVSYALAGKALVKPETRSRILAMANKLGYQASPLAQSMRTGRTSTIGLVAADISHPFVAEAARAAEDALSEEGYHLIIGNTNYRADRQRWQLEHLVRRQADGVILFLDQPDSPDVAWLQENDVPLVLLTRAHRSIKTDLVTIDDRHMIDVALDHLWALGHRRIGYLVWEVDSVLREARVEAYKAYLSARKAFDERLVRPCERSIEGGRAGAGELLRQGKPPTAIITVSDIEALGAMAAAKEIGLRIPEDVSIVGGGDTFLAALPQIMLTTPDQPRSALGSEAASLILHRIRHPSGRPKAIKLSPTLALRGSTTSAWSG